MVIKDYINREYYLSYFIVNAAALTTCIPNWVEEKIIEMINIERIEGSRPIEL